MQCFEYEMLCLALEAEIRSRAPAMSVDRTMLADTLAGHGIDRFTGDTMYLMAQIAERLAESSPGVPLAA